MVPSIIDVWGYHREFCKISYSDRATAELIKEYNSKQVAYYSNEKATAAEVRSASQL